MKNEGIEDILIDRTHENNNSGKSKKVIVFVVVFLLILSAGAYAYYKYSYSINNSSKKLFMRNLSNNNIDQVLDFSNYRIITSRILEENTITNTDFNVQSSLPSNPILKDKLANVDLSKFDLKATTKIDNTNQNYFSNFLLNYSGNTIFDLKLQLKNQAAYAFSDEIVTSYVGLKYEDFERFLGIKFSMNDIRRIRKSEKLDFSEEEKASYKEDYINYIFDMIPEEKFSTQDNIALEKASGTVDVTAYTLSLDKKEAKELAINVLTKLKNDDNLLKEFVSEREVYVEELQDNIRTINPQTEVEENNDELVYTIEGEEVTDNPNYVDPNDIVNSEYQGNGLLPDVLDRETESAEAPGTQVIIYEDTPQEQPEQPPAEEVVHIGDNENNNNNNNNNDNSNTNSLANTTNTVESVIISEMQGSSNEFNTSIELDPEVFYPVVVTPVKKTKEIPRKYMELFKVFSGRKSSVSISEVKSYIDELITKINDYDGGDFKFTIYKNAQNTEKIVITLPDDNTIEIEFTYVSKQEDRMKVSYIYKGSNNLLDYFFGDGEQIYSGVEELGEAPAIDNDKSNGFAITIGNIRNNSSNVVDVEYDFIENSEINKKLSTNIKTEGTKDSKTITNSAVINYSTNDGKIVYTIDSTTKFENEVDIEELTTGNSILLENLGDQIDSIVQSIKDRAKEVYNEKKSRTTFFDANVNNNVIDDKISRDEARSIIIDRVSRMMGDAIERNEEFTLRNLEGLSVAGYDITCNITERQAIVVINSYTFVINDKFEITDV